MASVLEAFEVVFSRVIAAGVAPPVPSLAVTVVEKAVPAVCAVRVTSSLEAPETAAVTKLPTVASELSAAATDVAVAAALAPIPTVTVVPSTLMSNVSPPLGVVLIAPAAAIPPPPPSVVAKEAVKVVSVLLAVRVTSLPVTVAVRVLLIVALLFSAPRIAAAVVAASVVQFALTVVALP